MRFARISADAGRVFLLARLPAPTLSEPAARLKPSSALISRPSGIFLPFGGGYLSPGGKRVKCGHCVSLVVFFGGVLGCSLLE